MKKVKKQILVPIVILKTKNGYNAFSPVIAGCIATDKTIDRTVQRMHFALEFHFEGERLVKHLNAFNTKRLLNHAFEEYGTDAFYASLNIAA